jgi:hypothetical protein
MAWLVLLFARRVWKLDIFFSRRFQNGLCAGGATAGHGFLDSGIVLCVFAGKTLGRFEPSAFAASNGYECRRFLLANFHGQAPLNPNAPDSSMLRGRGGRRRMTSIEVTTECATLSLQQRHFALPLK